MAFYLSAENSDGNELPEVGFSHGVLVYWAKKAAEYNLPIMAEMYETAFSEGFHIFGEQLKELKNEAELLNIQLEREGEERTIEYKNGGTITSNLVALDRFRNALVKAEEVWIS